MYSTHNKGKSVVAERFIRTLTLWLPQVTGDPRNVKHSYDTTIFSFGLTFFPLSWCSINLYTNGANSDAIFLGVWTLEG